MKKRLIKNLLLVLTMAVLCFAVAVTASAETEGYYTYEVYNRTASIIEVDTEISGEIVIPDVLGGCPVTNIDYRAFDYCENITGITIPDSVIDIGQYAFSFCSSLENIIIADSVRYIHEQVFEGCYKLKDIIIPDGVLEIGDNAFSDTAYFNNTNNWENDVLYIGKHLIKARSTISGEYVIKEGTKTIANSAFSFCRDLTSIIISDGLKTIGSGSFEYCYDLENVTIPNSVLSIGNGAFIGCRSFDNIVIPDSVITMDSGAFLDTKYYNNADNWENDVLYVGKRLITAKESISGECIIKEGTEIIVKGAFSSCPNLKSVIVPDSVILIDKMAFDFCRNLEKIDLGEGLNTIGFGAFWGCVSLKSIVIPDSVTTIGEDAFLLCTSLSKVHLGKSVKTLEGRPFICCYSIENITVDEENPCFCTDDKGVLYSKDKSVLVLYPQASEDKEYVVYNSTTEIFDCAFMNCLYLENLVLPDGLKKIDSWAFAFASSFDSIVLPETVEYIGEAAFYNVIGLKSVVISSSLVEIDETAFVSWYDIKKEDIEFLKAYYKTANPSDEMIEKYESISIYFDDAVPSTTIHCHEKTVVESFAVENGVPYELYHFYEGDWTYDYDNMIRYRECTFENCDAREEESLETTGSGDVEIIEPVDPDTDFVVDVITDYVIIEEALSNGVAGDFEIVRAFDITMKNKDGVHVQPDGTVKVKLPLDWSKDGIYKVYRVNDDGTLTDMNAYRQGSHMVFDADHFSVYVIVDESEKTDDPNITEKDEVCPDCGRPTHEDTVVQNFVCWLLMLFKFIASLF